MESKFDRWHGAGSVVRSLGQHTERNEHIEEWPMDGRWLSRGRLQLLFVCVGLFVASWLRYAQLIGRESQSILWTLHHTAHHSRRQIHLIIPEDSRPWLLHSSHLALDVDSVYFSQGEPNRIYSYLFPLCIEFGNLVVWMALDILWSWMKDDRMKWNATLPNRNQSVKFKGEKMVYQKYDNFNENNKWNENSSWMDGNMCVFFSPLHYLLWTFISQIQVDDEQRQKIDLQQSKQYQPND